MKFIISSIILLFGTGGLGFLSFYQAFMSENKKYPIAIAAFASAIVLLILAFVCIHQFLVRKLKNNNASINEQLSQWKNISYYAQKAGDESFHLLPIGIMIYDEAYQISWANEYALSRFGENIVKDELKVSDVSNELYDIAINQNKQAFLLNYKNKFYDVTHNPDYRILYFFDETARENLNKRYNDRITGLGIIALDNLEESLKKFDVQEKANIRGQILGIVTDWLEKYKCYLQSVSSDRYLFIMDQESLNAMIADKFSILNDVHNVSQTNRLKATLSMGIACYDVSYEELGTIANNAIELAEKRGGDQIVVNVEHKKIQFYGGNANSQEKNTLIEARMQTVSLKEAVEDSSDVLIMCHNFADTDAFGSMIGVYHMIASTNKPVKMVFEPERADRTVKKVFYSLEAYPEIRSYFIDSKTAIDMIKPTTLLIVTDTQSPSLVMFKDLFQKAERLSIIDHHRAGDPGYSDYLTYYVETSASSAVELVSEMFMFYNSNIKVTPLEASIMLSGIIVDTNNFTMRAGTRTFEAAATLKSMGADMIYVKKLLQETLDSEKIIADALLKADIYYGKFAIVNIGDVTIPDRTMLAKISDKLLEVAGVEASFTIGRINNDTVGISARSLGDSINVQIIMELMGGGGHFNSAACQLKDKSVDEIQKELIEQLREEYIDKNAASMQVLLLEDIKGKGKKDDVITVSSNLANKLITAKQAIEASEEALKKLEAKKAKAKQQSEAHKDILKKFRQDIDGKNIKVYLTDEDGKSKHITKTLICEEFMKQTGITLNRTKVELPGEISARGIYTVTVKLDTDVTASFAVLVEDRK